MQLTREVVYLDSVFMDLDAVAIKFALNNNFLPMKLDERRVNVHKEKKNKAAKAYSDVV